MTSDPTCQAIPPSVCGGDYMSHDPYMRLEGWTRGPSAELRKARGATQKLRRFRGQWAHVPCDVREDRPPPSQTACLASAVRQPFRYGHGQQHECDLVQVLPQRRRQPAKHSALEEVDLLGGGDDRRRLLQRERPRVALQNTRVLATDVARTLCAEHADEHVVAAVDVGWRIEVGENRTRVPRCGGDRRCLIRIARPKRSPERLGALARRVRGEQTVHLWREARALGPHVLRCPAGHARRR
mmetsp:Transcript_10922/g.35004  ORF Transcript_10922/g.35004 Transcript_10922/m.35004 type:complete len:241 (-) Transcript_10922:175-897(-)